jgi:transposase
VEVLKHHSKEASVGEVTTIGLDLAKSIFQAHGADADGEVVFRKKLRRDQMLGFFAAQPRCLVAMEACAGAHHWARELAALGHDVRLMPPSYVKPFVKRQKNDMADAEAISEAAQRPTMRFVAPKSAEAQGAAVIFRTRDLLVRQRTQLSNALRGHLAEFGFVVPQGVGHVSRLIALVALAPPASTFRRGRDFAAWVGLTPRQNSSGGKERLGRISKMGERNLRRLLILGASSAAKVAARDPSQASPWLAGMLPRKPRMLVTVALANKIARIVWALMAHGGSYRAPTVAA